MTADPKNPLGIDLEALKDLNAALRGALAPLVGVTATAKTLEDAQAAVDKVLPDFEPLVPQSLKHTLYATYNDRDTGLIQIWNHPVLTNATMDPGPQQYSDQDEAEGDTCLGAVLGEWLEVAGAEPTPHEPGAALSWAEWAAFAALDEGRDVVWVGDPKTWAAICMAMCKNNGWVYDPDARYTIVCGPKDKTNDGLHQVHIQPRPR